MVGRRFFGALCAVSIGLTMVLAAPAAAGGDGGRGGGHGGGGAGHGQHGRAEVPEVTGPLEGQPVLYGHTTFDLATQGYRQTEFLLTGTAQAYTATTPLTSDGRWDVERSQPADYTTRIVVNAPTDRRHFNGTVLVEWLNVSGGADASPDWIHSHVELIREGYAWVGVSAQAVGVGALQAPELGDPDRYAPLLHPGDSYSYDLFSQAGQAVWSEADRILGGLRPRHLIAVGESQSAGRLTTYLDAAQLDVEVYDGFLVHSRSSGGAPLTQAPLADVPTPTPTLVRTDLDVPVLVFQTENDVRGLLARQPDSSRYRLWEVAGTAHFDLYGLAQGATDTGGRDTVAAWFQSMLTPTAEPSPNFTCDRPINSGPQTFVLRAAVDALNDWVTRGRRPPVAPRYETVSVDPPVYRLDDDGNVVGGIRTPAVDAPVATLNGLGQSGASFCFLFGTTVPLSQERLEARYGSHRGFVNQWNRATRRAVRAGHLLPDDAAHLRAVAARSDVL